MPARGAEDSREVLLRAGEEILEELMRSGALDPLGVIRPTDVAARTDRSKALLYHLWPVDKDEPDKLKRYRADLLARVLRRSYDPASLTALAGGAADEGFREMVRQVANFEIDRFTERSPFQRAHRLSVLLAAGAELRGEASPLRQPEREEVYVELAQLYDALLRAYGRRMRPPLEINNLVIALSAMTEGFALESWYSGTSLAGRVAWHEREAVDDWSPFAIAVLAVAERMTEPRPCDAPSCDEPSSVLLTFDERPLPVALCRRHVWMELATADRMIDVLVEHEPIDPATATEVFPDSPRSVQRCQARWATARRRGERAP